MFEFGLGMPSSVDELVNNDGSPTGMLLAAAIEFSDPNKRKEREMYEGLQYYLDNCGGDEDHSAQWYCSQCDQEECGKRACRRHFIVTDSWETDEYGTVLADTIKSPFDGTVWKRNDKDEFEEMK